MQIQPSDSGAHADQATHDKARRQALRAGLRDGVPVALGYFAVSFALGIAARNAGLTAFQGFLASLLNNASAGQYAGFALIAAQAAYWEVALVTLIANARYFLMSCALSQKISRQTPFYHRLIIGFNIPDELFGLAIARPGFLDPFYYYGAMIMAMPGWAFGTAAGVIAGNLLPLRVVSALSVALFGMFLAVIVPPSTRNKTVAGVVTACFALSYLAARTPGLASLSNGLRIIILTLAIAGLAAVLFPIDDDGRDSQDET